MTTVLAVVDDREIAGAVTAIERRADALEVCGLDSANAMGVFLGEIKALKSRVGETFDGPVKKAHELHKELVAKRKGFLDPLERAESVGKGKVVAWTRAEEARIRKANEEAEAEARQESNRLAKEAREREESRRLEEAAALEHAGHHEEAAAIIAEQVIIAPPIVVVNPAAMEAPPKVAGVSVRTNWKARVTDLHALVRHVAANLGHLGLVEPNAPALNAMARSLKCKSPIPGVEFYDDSVVAMR